jgi:hypothetical protein
LRFAVVEAGCYALGCFFGFFTGGHVLLQIVEVFGNREWGIEVGRGAILCLRFKDCCLWCIVVMGLCSYDEDIANAEGWTHAAEMQMT